MKYVVVNNDSDLVDVVIQLLQDGHDVLFLYVEGQDSPFRITFNCAQDDNWERQLNSLCETYNFSQRCKRRYREVQYPDRDELFAALEEELAAFQPDRIIRSKSDAFV